MTVFLVPLFQVAYYALVLYTYVVLAYVICSLLVNFQILNPAHPFVASILDFLWRATNPALARLRRFIPSIGPVDITPLVLLLVIYFAQGVLLRTLALLMVG